MEKHKKSTELNLNCLRILDALLGTALLDMESEALDCLDVFGDHAWSCRAGADEARFDVLVALGHKGNLTRSQLDELMELVSEDSQAHVYFYIYQGHKLMAEQLAVVEESSSG